MTATRLCLADLTLHEDEARVLDLRLAEVLEFERPRAIRQLIERNEDELRRYGALPRRVATPVNGGPQFEEYWLNEPQAVILCMKSETPRAADARAEIIAVFMAWRKGATLIPSAAPITIEAIGTLFDNKVEPLSRRLGRIENAVLLRRREFGVPAKNELCRDTHRLGGRCPACGLAVVVNPDGDKRPPAEYDHFYTNTRPEPENGWLVCKDCHDGLTSGRVPRYAREAQFRAFQDNRSRLPGRQQALFG